METAKRQEATGKQSRGFISLDVDSPRCGVSLLYNMAFGCPRLTTEWFHDEDADFEQNRLMAEFSESLLEDEDG